jgi:hypothetical protein
MRARSLSSIGCPALVVVLLGACEDAREEEEVDGPDTMRVEVDHVEVPLNGATAVPVDTIWHPITVQHPLVLESGDRVVAVLEVGLGSNPCTQAPLVEIRTLLSGQGNGCGVYWPPQEVDHQFTCTTEFPVVPDLVGEQTIQAQARVTGGVCDSVDCALNNRSLNLLIIHEHP